MILKDRSIIIVEDDYDIYNSLVTWFKGKGLLVYHHPEGENIPVDNYQDALDLIKRYNPDIIIADIILKQSISERDRLKNGLDLCEYVKKHFNAYVVILTSTTDTRNPRIARQAAVDDYVLKLDKNASLDQLWVALQLHYPLQENYDKDKGRQFKVSENTEKKAERVYKEKHLYWDSITHIEAYSGVRNSIQIYTALPNKKYICRITLGEIAELLPPDFVRVNKWQIVNGAKVNAKSGRMKYYIDELEFTIGPNYYSHAVQAFKI